MLFIDFLKRVLKSIEEYRILFRLLNRFIYDTYIYLFIYAYIPESSKCVKFVPLHLKNLPKGRKNTCLEDPGIYNKVHFHTYLGKVMVSSISYSIMLLLPI